jgi:hypothetical protein
VVCGVVGYAFLGSLLAAGLSAPFFGVQAVITTLLGKCSGDGISRSLARQTAGYLGVAAGLFALVFAGPPALAVSASLGALAAALSEFGNTGSVTASTTSATLSAGESLARAHDQGALADGLGIASRVVQASSSSSSSSGSRMLISYPKISTPLSGPAAYATVLLQAAKVTADAEPGRDLRPLLRDVAEREAKYVQGEVARRFGAGLAGAAAPGMASVKYLAEVAGNATPGPWDVATVAAILNEPSRVFGGAPKKPDEVLSPIRPPVRAPLPLPGPGPVKPKEGSAFGPLLALAVAAKLLF